LGEKPERTGEKKIQKDKERRKKTRKKKKKEKEEAIKEKNKEKQSTSPLFSQNINPLFQSLAFKYELLPLLTFKWFTIYQAR
jgi:hypothetical protein